jgi:ribonuclease BN (tRNA processing enzyme)
MKITFLGTNGWYTNSQGNTPCILIESNNQYVVLDAGNGIYKLDEYIKEPKKISLFISHFHLDHVAGVHILNKFKFEQGIDVYVGKGRRKDFETLVNPPFTVGFTPRPENIYNLKTQTRLHELSEQGENIPFKAQAIKVHHAYTGHGYRFELDGKIIAYTGDCGVTPAVYKLAKNADVLICECSNKKSPNPDPWGHFDPVQAATLAKEQNVGKLFLTHFGTNNYKNKEDRIWAQEEARKIFPETTAAFDDLSFEI